MQLAKYFRKNKKSILCELCPHGCNISNGNIGYCLARKNIDGKLYAINYGKISSIALDPIKKKPLYHFFPGKKILSIGSYGCNMKCLFCQNFEISQHIPNTKFIEPKEILDIAMSIENNIGIAFTYNEPTISIEYILELAPLIKKNNLHNVMVSNGMINKKPLNDLLKYIDAFNIDLKAFTNKFYKKHGGDLKTVMRNIKTI
jgi:pyruvate formate lyase activating enzyme